MFPCRPCSRTLRSLDCASSSLETSGSDPRPFGLRCSGGTGGSLLIEFLLSSFNEEIKHSFLPVVAVTALIDVPASLYCPRRVYAGALRHLFLRNLVRS